MKAAVFQGINNLLMIERVPDPEINDDEILLKVKYCGICGSDLHCTQEGKMLMLPGTILGHEFSGEIIEIGKKVNKSWKLGELITAMPAQGCGQCHYCKKKSCFLCEKMNILGLSYLSGAYAEYVKINSASAIKLPVDFDAKIGALIEPYAVALHAIKLSKYDSTDKVLILGAGPIGLAIADILSSKVSHLIITDKLANRRELATKLGVTTSLPPDDLLANFQNLAGTSPTLIFECIGMPGALNDCIDLASTKSQLVVVGACMHDENICSLKATMKELVIKFSLASTHQDFKDVVSLFSNNKIKGLPIISDIVNLSELPETFEQLRSPSTQSKVLISPE